MTSTQQRKYYYVSDLHIDVNKTIPFDTYIDNNKQNDNVLIIAGDLITTWNPELVISFLTFCKTKFETVIYILGNHEFHMSPHKYIDSTINAYDKLCKKCGVVLLSYLNPYIKFENEIVIGVTLWANPYQFGKPLTFTNDIYAIPCMSVDRYTQLHIADMDSLTRTVSDFQLKNEHRKLIIVTHFSPLSEASLNPKYKGNPVNTFFCTPLYDYMKTISSKGTYWIYGHTHHNTTEIVDNVTVVSNCFGHGHECKDFSKNKYILM